MGGIEMEEDIRILEFWKEAEIEFPLLNFRKPIFPEREKQALENLLTRYKQLEENQLWSEATIEGLKKDFIPKSKIKEKIEELEKYIYKGENAPQDFLQYRVKAKIQVLQELLDS